MYHPVYSRMSSNYKEEKPEGHWCQEGPPFCAYGFNRRAEDATREALIKHYEEEHPDLPIPPDGEDGPK